MNKIIILTDSTCDLSEKLVQERDIKIIPLKVCFGQQSFDDGVDINTKQMYEKVEKEGTLPKTAAVTTAEFEKIFEDLVADGNDVIYTGISSLLSSSYQNCVVARSNLDEKIASHIYPVDSMNLSTGIGLTVLKMCDMRDKGMSAQEIVDEAKKIVPCVRAQFSVKDLTYLHKGGRCSGTKKFFGTMLRIRPILRVFEGKIIFSEKEYGKYTKALDLQIKDLLKNLDNIDKDYLFITDSLAHEESIYIWNALPKDVINQFKHIYITNAGCVVSSHCGKGTIGILYIKNAPLTTDK